MASDPANSLVMEAVDIYIAPLGSDDPTDITEDFPAAWAQVGIIDGDSGIEEAREWGKDNDFYGIGPAGSILVTSVKGQFKLTRKFEFLEDSENTRKILWPGSTETLLVTPQPVPTLLGMTVWYQNGTKERLITKNRALINVEGYSLNEELTKFPATATIYPTVDGELFTRQVQAPVEP